MIGTTNPDQYLLPESVLSVAIVVHTFNYAYHHDHCCAAVFNHLRWLSEPSSHFLHAAAAATTHITYRSFLRIENICAYRMLLQVSLGGMTFDFADTGGLEDGADEPWKAPRGDDRNQAYIGVQTYDTAVESNSVLCASALPSPAITRALRV